MINEIYCRMPGDPGYQENAVETPNEIESILQRVRICLGTKPGEVLGDPTFGIDLEEYIYNMSVDVNMIETQVRDLLVQYALKGYTEDFDIEVKAYYGKNITDASDYILLDIYINNIKYMGIIIT
jgi:phage baseplate assembly protein W